ncbi:MAG: HlyD family efflux transporter periplasmic adaptor subunit, partial [Planctomycetales bacterium]
REDVKALEAAVRAAKANVAQSNAAVTSAEGQVSAAEAGIASAAAEIKEADAGVLAARATIAQVNANLAEAKNQATRAARLADRRAGSVETAEAKAASVESMQAQLDGANASLAKAQATVENSKAAHQQAQSQLVIAQNGRAEKQAAVLTSTADKEQAEANLGESGDANVRIRQAKVQLDEARLQLKWTKIYAPSNGFVSNLYVSGGTYAVVGSPLVAFVDSDTFRVHGYFTETKLRHIKQGDPVVVTLMGYGDQPIEGVVESIGHATNPPDVVTTEGEMGVVPQIEPTFDWVRLAQRVPVRIRLTKIPQGLQLVSGTTASIAIESR